MRVALIRPRGFLMAKAVAKHDAPLSRCWGNSSPAMREYHDTIWGRPTRDCNDLFGRLTLQIFQAGLAWKVVMSKMDGLADAFARWDVNSVAKFSDTDINRLANDERIIRNRLKIKATVTNAQIVSDMEQKEPGSFVEFVWSLRPSSESELYLSPFASPVKTHMRTDFQTKASGRLHADGVHPTASVAEATLQMRRRGFKFCGETTVLCFMQAAGLVNHHGLPPPPSGPQGVRDQDASVFSPCFAWHECNAVYRDLFPDRPLPPLKFPDGSSVPAVLATDAKGLAIDAEGLARKSPASASASDHPSESTVPTPDGSPTDGEEDATDASHPTDASGKSPKRRRRTSAHP
eukprot:TRINITY_DN5613_c0_g1_i2.p1 TRINITY_DN5613_c0_g1~~TRINITY_DN5613_c0_g1_i2.p1  ORF type:complete len:348 (+),score=27.85 TRINITY_DN5613_c0_g1_i2:77-1120(+)